MITEYRAASILLIQYGCPGTNIKAIPANSHTITLRAYPLINKNGAGPTKLNASPATITPPTRMYEEELVYSLICSTMNSNSKLI